MFCKVNQNKRDSQDFLQKIGDKALRNKDYCVYLQPSLPTDGNDRIPQPNNTWPMTHHNLLRGAYRLYADGFREMTLGRVLWLVVLVKLFVIFFVLKLFFFPDVLAQRAGGDKATYVATQLTSGPATD